MNWAEQFVRRLHPKKVLVDDGNVSGGSFNIKRNTFQDSESVIEMVSTTSATNSAGFATDTHIGDNTASVGN